MQESVIYQDIIQKGMQKGVLETVTLLLTDRFGALDENLQQRIEQHPPSTHYSVAGFGTGIVQFIFGHKFGELVTGTADVS